MLFPGSGGTPPFTASGIDPAIVGRLPWPARRPVAEMTDRGQALAAVQTYLSADGELLAQMDYANHPSNQPYTDAMRAWLSGTPTAGLPPFTRDQPSAGASQPSTASMSDDAAYAALFPEDLQPARAAADRYGDWTAERARQFMSRPGS